MWPVRMTSESPFQSMPAPARHGRGPCCESKALPPMPRLGAPAAGCCCRRLLLLLLLLLLLRYRKRVSRPADAFGAGVGRRRGGVVHQRALVETPERRL